MKGKQYLSSDIGLQPEATKGGVQHHSPPKPPAGKQLHAPAPVSPASRAERVDLQQDAVPLPLPNDDVFALLGGESPEDFLRKIGIEIVEKVLGESTFGSNLGPTSAHCTLVNPW